MPMKGGPFLALKKEGYVSRWGGSSEGLVVFVWPNAGSFSAGCG